MTYLHPPPPPRPAPRKNHTGWIVAAVLSMVVLGCCVMVVAVGSLDSRPAKRPVDHPNRPLSAVTTAAEASASSSPSAPPVIPITGQPVAPKTTKPASIYYANCAAARAAGAAPLHRGEPGYRSALDRDGDGTACDK